MTNEPQRTSAGRLAAIKISLLFVAGVFSFQKKASLSTSPCWMRKRVEKSSAILALLDGYHGLHLDR